MAFRRFMPTRKFWISMRWRIKLRNPRRIFRRVRVRASRLRQDFFSRHPRAFRQTCCNISRS